MNSDDDFAYKEIAIQAEFMEWDGLNGISYLDKMLREKNISLPDKEYQYCKQKLKSIRCYYRRKWILWGVVIIAIVLYITAGSVLVKGSCM